MKDWTGHAVGKIVVEGPGAGRRQRNGSSVRTWIIRCECGKQSVVDASALAKNRQKSCGCSRAARIGYAQSRFVEKRRAISRLTVALNSAYSQHCNGSRRGRGFLAREVWESVVLQPCHYCGRKDLRLSHHATVCGRTDEAVRFVGVDRIDSAKGYTPENVLPCCSLCNRAKGALSYEAFIAWIHLVHTHHPIAPEDSATLVENAAWSFKRGSAPRPQVD